MKKQFLILISAITLISCNSKNINNYNLMTMESNSFNELINNLGGKIELEESHLAEGYGMYESYHKLVLLPNNVAQYSYSEVKTDGVIIYSNDNTYNGTWNVSHDESKLKQSIQDYSSGAIKDYIVIEVDFDGKKSVGIIYKDSDKFQSADIGASMNAFENLSQEQTAIGQGTVIIPYDKIYFE